MSKPVEQKNKITPAQFAFMVIQTQVGIAVLSLPHEVQAVAKGGGWISVLSAGLMAELIILLHWALVRRFPQDTIYEILTKLMGKWIGKGVGLLYVLYFFSINIVVALMFADVVGRWILIKTPRWAIVLLLMIAGVYLARESVRAVARFYVAVSFLFVLFVVLTILAYRDANFYYIFPITEAGWFNILVKGAHQAIIAMTGYELLILLNPFIQGTSKTKLLAASVGNLFVTLLYTFITFTTLVVFSPEELQLIPEPVLYKHKALSLQVLERIDLIFLSVWSVTVVTSVVTYLYLAALGIKHLIHKKQIRRKSVSFMAGAVLFIVMFIQSPEQVQMINDLVANLSYFFLVFIPLLLLLLSFILKNKVTKSS
jgi:spore germination protein (amino acid permease)